MPNFPCEATKRGTLWPLLKMRDADLTNAEACVRNNAGSIEQ